MSDLCRIVYCSRSNLTGSRGEVERQVRQILATARRNNHHAGLTGALAFNENFFAQVLEGPITDLSRIFGRIHKDPRHSDLRMLQRSAASRRLFSSWSMAYADTPAGKARHPLAHFVFESALTGGASPEAEEILSALCRTVVNGGTEPVII